MAPGTIGANHMELVLFDFMFVLMLVPPALLYGVSLKGRFGKLRGGAAHPYNVLGFFFSLIASNFLFMRIQWAQGDQSYFGRQSIASQSEINGGAAMYLAFEFAILVGVMIGAFRKHAPDRYCVNELRRDQAIRYVLWMAAAATSIATFIVLQEALRSGGLFSVANVRQTYFSENPLLVPLYGLFAPAAIFYAARNARNKTKLAFLFILGIALLLPLGSRSAILYIVLAIFTAYSVSSRRIGVWALYAAAPIVAMVLFILRYYREYSMFGTFDEFLTLKGSQMMFGGADFQFAEPLVIAANYQMVDRYPFESALGMLMAYVPRSVAPFKPEGASTVYSMTSDPLRWSLFQSEWVIGGLANLKVEFGVVGAAVVLMALAYFWSSALNKAATRGAYSLAVASSFATVICFLFLRTDLYNLSFFLWPTILITVAISMVRRVKWATNYRTADQMPPTLR